MSNQQNPERLRHYFVAAYSGGDHLGSAHALGILEELETHIDAHLDESHLQQAKEVLSTLRAWLDKSENHKLHLVDMLTKLTAPSTVLPGACRECDVLIDARKDALERKRALDAKP